MNVSWLRTVEPTTEPITATEAKLHCRATNTAEAALFTDLIAAARDAAEQYLMRGLFTQTWKLTQDYFSDEIWLPRAAPLGSVTSVKYYDGDGTQQTLATTVYLVDDQSEPARIVIKPNQTWPALQSGRAMAVEVIYVVGWTTVATIPAAIKQAQKLMIGDYYKQRENTVTGTSVNLLPTGVEALLAPYRVWWRPPC